MLLNQKKKEEKKRQDELKKQEEERKKAELQVRIQIVNNVEKYPIIGPIHLLVFPSIRGFYFQGMILFLYIC